MIISRNPPDNLTKQIIMKRQTLLQDLVAMQFLGR